MTGRDPEYNPDKPWRSVVDGREAPVLTAEKLDEALSAPASDIPIYPPHDLMSRAARR